MSPSGLRIVNPLDSHIGYQLRRLSTKLMADLATRLKKLGLRPVDATVLVLIENNPLITQAKLGVTLGILPANMVPLITRLMSRNLISREALDGKSQGFRLTADGEELCRQAKEQLQQHDASFFGGLSENQHTELRDKLKTFPQLSSTRQHTSKAGKPD